MAPSWAEGVEDDGLAVRWLCNTRHSHRPLSLPSCPLPCPRLSVHVLPGQGHLYLLDLDPGCEVSPRRAGTLRHGWMWGF